jgi:hypothetical protein
VSNLKRRLDRLEGGRRGQGIPIVLRRANETQEEAWQKHLAEHPEHATAEVRLFIAGRRQDPPGPPPARPKPKEPDKAPGPAPIIIID